MNTSLIIAGTVPSENISLIADTASYYDNAVHIGGETIPVNRGTAAMIGAACSIACFFNDPMPFCIIGGDIGKRSGSRQVYRYMIKHLPKIETGVLGLHYIVPDIGLHNQVLTAVRKMSTKPLLIADAGYMYVAKASGQAPFYDLFMPDLGETAFLADEKASHPAYTRGFLTRLENDPLELIRQASSHGTVPKHLCVKGRTDYISVDGEIVSTIDRPCIEELEPIGGTGDTITGMTVGLVSHGFTIPEACKIACRANREAGALTNISPADQIHSIINAIPAVLEKLL